MKPMRPGHGGGPTETLATDLARIDEVLERIESDLHLLIEVAKDQQRLLDLIARKLS